MPVYDDQKEKGSQRQGGDDDSFKDTVGHSINPAEEAEKERTAPNAAAEDIARREGLYNPDDTGTDEGKSKKELSSSDLQNAESGSGGPKTAPTPGGEGGSEFLQGARSKLKKLIKNKAFIGIAVGGGVSAGTILILIIMVLSLFKIPNFGEHIAAYQFARVTRDFARNSNSITATKMAVDAADDGTFSKLKAKYSESAAGQAQGKVKDTWSKLDKYRPNKVISNMKAGNTLKFNYSDPTTFRPNGRLRGVTIGDRTVLVQQRSFTSRFIPGVKFMNDISFSQQFAGPLQQATVSSDVGPIVRGLVGRQLRKELGISLIAWQVGKYRGKTPEQSKILIEQDSREKIKAGSTDYNPKVSNEINDTTKEANAAEEAALKDPEKAKAIIANPNELPQDVVNVLENSFKDSWLTRLLGFLNPVYAVATPLCMVYEGSLANSGSTINEQSAQAQRAFYMVMSASSQTKDGYEADGNAVGALGWKLGDIEASNPEIRASGKSVDTSKSFSTQSSPTGSFSIFDAIFPSPIDTVMDNAAKTCPIFTNIWAGIGLGIFNIALLIASLGTASVPEGAADVAANLTIKTVTKKIVEKMVSGSTFMKDILKNTAKDTAKNAAIIGGATFIANAIVLSQMGSQQSPLATGVPFANEADNGGNQHAQQIERQGLYGRPMTQDEVALSAVQDQQYLAAKTSSQSLVQRYLAPNNPDSLITRVATMTSQKFGSGNFTAIFNLGNSILNPIKAFGSVIGSLGSTKVSADDVDTFNYGNVQWGFSPAEEDKLALAPDTNLPKDPTYSVLENRLILDQSGKESEIADKYGRCFSADMQMGDLLTEETGEGGSDKYFIVRDTNGNVSADQGLCSPKNLSFNNPTYGDLVFRWRVDHAYDTGFEQTDEAQNPTDSDAPLGGSTTPPPGGDVIIGDTSDVPCSAGTDKGVADGYSGGKRYTIRICNVQGVTVNSQISGKIDALLNAAKAAGLPMTGYGFRTMQEQIALRAQNCADVYNSPPSSCSPQTAIPGYSNHQMGLAIDFGDNGQSICYPQPSASCTGNARFNWLTANAATYGLQNLSDGSEAWHWSTDGH